MRDARGRFVVSPDSVRGKLAEALRDNNALREQNAAWEEHALREQNAAWEEQWIRAVAHHDDAQAALKESAYALAKAQDEAKRARGHAIALWLVVGVCVAGFVVGALYMACRP